MIVMLAAAGVASADSVDVTNGNGTIPDQLLSSYGGLSSTNFVTDTNGQVSVWLRARNANSSDTVNLVPDNNNRYVLAKPNTTSDFSFEFQFTPASDDVVMSGTGAGVVGSNYWLKLEIDGDPSAGVDFTGAGVTFSSWVFDDDDGDGQFVKSPNGDIDDRDDDLTNGTTDSSWESGDDREELTADSSWDDGDSLIIDNTAVRNGPVSFTGFAPNGSSNLPEYVVVNSWRPKWWVENAVASGGLYDLQLSVYNGDPDVDGTAELASVRAQAKVVPEPLTMLAVGSAVVGLGGYIRRRRRA
jgi:hypothetical protein